MTNRATDGFGIRLAESPEDYGRFTRLVLEYIDSLGFKVDFQDVDLEIAEAQHRYGKPGRGAAIGIAGLRDLGGQICELKRM